jgi:hypothetical protein
LGGFGVYNGTLTNGPTWGTSGITFDGVNDYINTALATIEPELTLISVTTPSAGTTAMEIAKSNLSTFREFELDQVLSTLTSRLVTTGTAGITSLTGPVIVSGVCRFMCARLGASFRRLRRNNESDVTGTVVDRTTTAQNVTIGATSVVSRLFPGVIHASIIFNTAISDADTSSVYNLYKNTLGQGLGLP